MHYVSIGLKDGSFCVVVEDEGVHEYVAWLEGQTNLQGYTFMHMRLERVEDEDAGEEVIILEAGSETPLTIAFDYIGWIQWDTPTEVSVEEDTQSTQGTNTPMNEE